MLQCVGVMTEQYLPCNINYTCGGGSAVSPQWLPPFFGTHEGISNTGAAGTIGEALVLGPGGLGASGEGYTDLFTESDTFTLEVGAGMALPGITVSADLVVSVTIDSIVTISATSKRLIVTATFAGTAPDPNESFYVPVYAANGNPAEDDAHREFVGYVQVMGIQA